ncbi:MAG: helix-turn-helix domain-containing protein [Endomicrobium sp.]|jgi:transcriptional regulator with XRE-family HTH domain|nr:helix-turn-helix domain-containing protein [Endomicrobium sp.]
MPKKMVTTIGKSIEKAVIDADLTRGELAKELGITAKMVGHWITGYRNPSLPTLQKIAKATKKNLGYFLDSSVKDVAINTGDNSAVGRNASTGTSERINELEKEIAYLKGKIDILEKLLKKDK